jgi:outer membrane protein, heavy metal efflux system
MVTESTTASAGRSAGKTDEERQLEAPVSPDPPIVSQVNHLDPAIDLPTPEESLAASGSAPNATGLATNEPLPATLSLADLESIALQHNPTLVQAQAEIAVDQGLLKQAGLYPNPQIGYINGTASNPSVKQSNGVFLSQEFVTAHKLDLAQQAIVQEIKRMQWDQEAQRLRVLNDLKIRYFEVLGAQQGVSVAGRLVDVATESVALSEKFVGAKLGTRTDVLQAKVQLETAKLNLEEAQDRHAAAWSQLATMMGTPGFKPVPLSGNLTGEFPDLDPETCLQQLLAQSPQLSGSQSALDHGWAEYHSAKAQAIPNVTIQSVIDYDKATQSTTASTLVALPLPIYNRNQGNIDKAAADIRIYQAEITRVEMVLREQLADSFRRYQASRRQAERLKTLILPNVEESLQLSREIYAAGQAGFSSVLTAQQDYFKSQMAYVEALTEMNKVVVEIEGLQLTGGLNPPAIGSAIQAQPGGSSQRQRALLQEVQDRASKQLLPAAQIGQ